MHSQEHTALTLFTSAVPAPWLARYNRSSTSLILPCRGRVAMRSNRHAARCRARNLRVCKCSCVSEHVGKHKLV